MKAKASHFITMCIAFLCLLIAFISLTKDRDGGYIHVETSARYIELSNKKMLTEEERQELLTEIQKHEAKIQEAIEKDMGRSPSQQ